MIDYNESIKKCVSLDELFSLWVMKQPETISFKVGKDEKFSVIDHANKFITDGIVNEGVWRDTEHKKILYVLKEAYTADDTGYDLAYWLKSEPNYRMWNRVARWTYGLQNTSANEIAKYDPDIDKVALDTAKRADELMYKNKTAMKSKIN